MMSKKALFGVALVLSAVLLSTFIFASVNTMSWQLPFFGSTATIFNGDSISFTVAVASFNPGASYTINLFDNNYNLVRNLRSGTTDSSNLHSEIVTITPVDYASTGGVYHIVTYSTEGSGTGLAEDVDTLDLVVISFGPWIFGIPDVAMVQDTVDTSIDLDNYVFSDDPLSTLTWTASGNTNIAASIDSATHVVTLTPNAGWTGSETITFDVTDLSGNTDSDSITVTVNPTSTISNSGSSSSAKREAALTMIGVEEAEGNFILIRSNGVNLEDFRLNVDIDAGSKMINREFRRDLDGNMVLYEDLAVNLEAEGLEPGTYLAKITATSADTDGKEEGYLLVDLN